LKENLHQMQFDLSKYLSDFVKNSKMQLKQSELDTATKELERLKLVEQEQLDTLELQLAEFRVQKEKARQKADQPEDLVALIESKKAKMDMELAKMREHMLNIKLQNQKKGKQTRLNTQNAKIKRLDKEVKEYRASIEKMSVKAPKSGMLVYSTDWRGRKKAVGDRTWKGATIMELPDLDKMQVKAMIPEPEAWKVKENLPVEIRLDSNPDRIFKGTVKSLGRIFHPKSWDQPMMVFDAVIDVEDPDPELMRPGMAADIDIIVSSRNEVLQIPENALIYREKGIYVWKKSFPGKKLVPVTPGKRSGGMVEILDGLSPDDEILIPREGNGEN